MTSPLLLQHFLLAAAARYEREPPVVSAADLQALMRHDWPGNVRELRNLAERLVLFGSDEDIGIVTADVDAVNARAALPEQVAAFEKAIIVQALREANGSAAEAIEKLGLPRKTFYDKLRKYGPEASRLRLTELVRISAQTSAKPVRKTAQTGFTRDMNSR